MYWRRWHRSDEVRVLLPCAPCTSSSVLDSVFVRCSIHTHARLAHIRAMVPCSIYSVVQLLHLPDARFPPSCYVFFVVLHIRDFSHATYDVVYGRPIHTRFFNRCLPSCKSCQKLESLLPWLPERCQPQQTRFQPAKQLRCLRWCCGSLP